MDKVISEDATLHTFGYYVKVANRELRPSNGLVDSPNTAGQHARKSRKLRDRSREES
jgi:hypothetical protein